MTNQNKTRYHNYFSLELISETLSWLPVKFLVRFKCVSKSWYELIDDPHFIQLRFSRRSHLKTIFDTNTLILESIQKETTYIYSIDVYHTYQHLVTQLPYPKDIARNAKIVASCNGLLCFLYALPNHPFEKFLSLYNPVTNVHKKLPQFNFDLKSKYSEVFEVVNFAYKTKYIEIVKMVALGYESYDRKSNDNKILKFTELWNSDETRRLDRKSLVYRLKTNVWEIYRLKTNVWEIIENPPWEWDWSVLGTSTIFANNSFYWLKYESEHIKCFDLFTQRYYTMPLPEGISTNRLKLSTLKGQLCLVTFYLNIWILNEHEHEHEHYSWTRIFHTQCGSLNIINDLGDWRYLNFACLKDGSNNNDNIILVSSGYSQNLKRFLICCNLESETIRKISMSGLLPNDPLMLPVQPWVESLVPLH